MTRQRPDNNACAYNVAYVTTTNASDGSTVSTCIGPYNETDMSWQGIADNFVAGSESCSYSGTSSMSGAAFSSSSNFCGASRESATCSDAQHVCVARPSASSVCALL